MQSIRKRTLLALSLLQAVWIAGCGGPAMSSSLIQEHHFFSIDLRRDNLREFS
jgi:hypothetical protein